MVYLVYFLLLGDHPCGWFVTILGMVGDDPLKLSPCLSFVS